MDLNVESKKMDWPLSSIEWHNEVLRMPVTIPFFLLSTAGIDRWLFHKVHKPTQQSVALLCQVHEVRQDAPHSPDQIPEPCELQHLHNFSTRWRFYGFTEIRLLKWFSDLCFFCFIRLKVNVNTFCPAAWMLMKHFWRSLFRRHSNGFHTHERDLKKQLY